MRLVEDLRELRRHPMKRIELRARLERPLQVRRFHAFGEASIVDRPGSVYGAHLMAFGHHVLIGRGALLAVEQPAWGRPAPVLSFGDRVGVRPYCTFSAAESVTIEDDVIIGAFSGITDSDHTFALGRPNVMHNPLATGPVRIGRGTWVAERVSVLRGADIGRCCIIGANSVVRGTIPDLSIAVGAPARVVGEVTGVDPDDPSPIDALW